MDVLNYLHKKIENRPVHLTLLDPEKQPPETAAKIASRAADGGTDGIMIGGSVGISQHTLDNTAKEIKNTTDLPIILFPGDINGITKHADAIFFMSLLNSRNPYYITGAQALGAPVVKKVGIETIPMGYLIIEPGGTVGYIGDARLIPRERPDIAAAYALAAQYMGMKLVYLEAGSGADKHVPAKMIGTVKAAVTIPIIVGGGIKTKEDTAKVAASGADIIVTGTIVEKTDDIGKIEGKIKDITSVIKRH